MGRSPDETYATGSGNISKTTAVHGPLVLREVLLHFGASWNADVTVTLDAVLGATYDTVLQTMDAGAGCTDLTWAPEEKRIYRQGDQIKVTATNPGTVTYGLIIVTEAP